MFQADRLKQVSIFSSLENEYLEEIARITKKKSFHKNEVIFAQGDPGDTLFIMTAGAVKVSLIDSNGKETTLNILYEHDFFGEMALLDGHLRSATATALEPVTALTIRREDFIRCIKANPLAILNIMIDLCCRLRKTSEQVASLTFLGSSGKVAKILLDLALNEGQRKNGSIVLNLRFGRQELANMVALSRETLTRALYEFQNMGCLQVKGKQITIHNEGRLKEIIEQA